MDKLVDRNALLVAVGCGAVLQLALATTGHFVAFVADDLFALGGVAIALAAGAIYARRSGGTARPLAGGAAAGAGAALVGMAVSAALGDVPWLLLPFGLVAAAIAGVLGGVIGAGFAVNPPAPAPRPSAERR